MAPNVLISRSPLSTAAPTFCPPVDDAQYRLVAVDDRRPNADADVRAVFDLCEQWVIHIRVIHICGTILVADSYDIAGFRRQLS
jgi:hypothetical protein